MSQNEFEKILSKSCKALWNTLHSTKTFLPEKWIEIEWS